MPAGVSLSVHSEASCISCEAHDILVVARLVGAPRPALGEHLLGARTRPTPGGTPASEGAPARVGARDALEPPSYPPQLDLGILDDGGDFSLEQCGLGWRVCRRLRCRSTESIAAQRVSLQVETCSGAQIEHFCLLDARPTSADAPFSALGERDGRYPLSGTDALGAFGSAALEDLGYGEAVYVPIALRVFAEEGGSDDPSAPALEPLSVQVRLCWFDCASLRSAEATCVLVLPRLPPAELAAAAALPRADGALASAAIVAVERSRVLAERALATAAAIADGGDLLGASAALHAASEQATRLLCLGGGPERAPGSRALACVRALHAGARALGLAAARQGGGWGGSWPLASAACTDATSARLAPGTPFASGAAPAAPSAGGGGCLGAASIGLPAPGARGGGGAASGVGASAPGGAHPQPAGSGAGQPARSPAGAGAALPGGGGGASSGGGGWASDGRAALKPRTFALPAPLSERADGCAAWLLGRAGSASSGSLPPGRAGSARRASYAVSPGGARGLQPLPFLTSACAAFSSSSSSSSSPASSDCASPAPVHGALDGAQRTSTDGANGGSARPAAAGSPPPSSASSLAPGFAGAAAATGRSALLAVGLARTWHAQHSLGRHADGQPEGDGRARPHAGGPRAHGACAGSAAPLGSPPPLRLGRAPSAGTPPAGAELLSPHRGSPGARIGFAGSHLARSPAGGSAGPLGLGAGLVAGCGLGSVLGGGSRCPSPCAPAPPLSPLPLPPKLPPASHRLLRVHARSLQPAQLLPPHAHRTPACTPDGALGATCVGSALGASAGAAAHAHGAGAGGAPGGGVGGGKAALEAWLCRLLRRPLPVALPEDVIWQILAHVPPSAAFHPSLCAPTHVVDRSGGARGSFQTITAALRAAQHGDVILVHGGTYRESIRLDTCVSIVALGGAGRAGVGSGGAQPPARAQPGAGAGGGGGGGVVVTSARNHTLHSCASLARVCGLALRQTGSSGRSCVLTCGGRLELRGCDVSSACGLCVEVTDSARPLVVGCRVHEGAAAGLWFRAGGGGRLEHCEVCRNGWSGVQVSEGSHPLLRHNHIHDNKSAGLISFNGGRGLAVRNEIEGNGKGGVQVRSGASPTLLRNRIHHERSFGVWVYEKGLGTFGGNEIEHNAWSGLQVEEGSTPLVVANRLCGNRSAGIVVYNRGSGVYEWNEICANGRCGVQIKSGSCPLFRYNKIHHERQAGVLTAEDGCGTLEANDIHDNQWSGVQTEGPSDPLLRRNCIHHNGGAGFIAYQNGSGTLEGNDIYDNRKYGVQAKTGGHPIVRANRIHDKAFAIYLTEHGAGVFEGNSLHGMGAGRQGSGIYASADCSPVLSNNDEQP